MLFSLHTIIARIKNAEIASILKEGISIDSEDASWGNTALSNAARNGHDSVISFLLDRSANINWQHRDTKRTALIMAAGWNHESTVSLLLSRGADHTLQKLDGETALDWARLNDNHGVVRILEAHAARLNYSSAGVISDVRPSNVNQLTI
jgi:ankyrin repeat protein